MYLLKNTFYTNIKRVIILLSLIITILSISLADQNPDWQLVCRDKPLDYPGCQVVSNPSIVNNKKLRLLVRLSISSRPQVVILSSHGLYFDRSYRGDVIIKIDDNDQIQFKYVQYGFMEKGEANVLASVADTPLLLQMRRGLKLRIRIKYNDGDQHTHEIGLLGFTRAMSQL
jgi:hypothetical protein